MFYAWTIAGAVDLVLAVTLGALHSTALTPAGPGVTTDVVGLLPLSLIPTFGVPLTLALHAIAWYRAARTGQRPGRA